MFMYDGLNTTPPLRAHVAVHVATLLAVTTPLTAAPHSARDSGRLQWRGTALGHLFILAWCVAGGQVPCTGDLAGRAALLLARGHLVRRLHLRRDRDGHAFVHQLQRDRPALQNLPVRTPGPAMVKRLQNALKKSLRGKGGPLARRGVPKLTKQFSHGPMAHSQLLGLPHRRYSTPSA